MLNRIVTTIKLLSEISPENLCEEDHKYPGDYSTPICTRKPPALKTVRPTIRSSRPILKTKCPTTPHSLQKSSQRLIHYTNQASQRPDTGVFSIYSDEDEGSMKVIRSVSPKTYKKSSSKTTRKDMTTGSSISITSITKPKAARSLAKKVSEEENVYDINITESPKDIVLEVPRLSKTKAYKNVSKHKDSEDTVEMMSIEQSKKSKMKVENLNDTNDPLITKDNPDDDVLVPMSSQINKHKNSSWQKGFDDASSTTKPENGTRPNIDCTAEIKSSTYPDGSLPTLAQVKGIHRRGRPSKSVAGSNRSFNKTSRVEPSCFEDGSIQIPSARSRGRPSRSTRTLR